MGVNDIFQAIPFDQLVSLADRGDAGACVTVGYRYLHGLTANRDERQATQYFQKAGPSTAAVAWLNFMAIACRKKPPATGGALANLKVLADAGDATAKTLLGRCY